MTYQCKKDTVVLTVTSLEQDIAVGERFLMNSRSKNHRRKLLENGRTLARWCRRNAPDRILWVQSSKVVLQYSVQYMHDIHFKLTIKQILELCSLVDEPYSKSSVTLYGYSRCFIEGG